MRCPIATALFVCLLAGVASAQTATLHIDVRSHEVTVPDADVLVNGTPYKTNAQGVVDVTVQPGTVVVAVVKSGYVPANVAVDVQRDRHQSVVIELAGSPSIEETVIVSATRTDQRLEDVPMRVEVLAREEIEEKLMMTPGDIVMMLNEMGGMRVQATSPALGAASVRIQGMRGRYTRVLSDGLPLFGDAGGLGLLQIPPMDLGQVEVIKGVASALYGAGAMGGVVNLISRRPAATPLTEALVNRSTHGATDTVLFTARPITDHWRFSLLTGGHWQQLEDVDHDGWADLPRYGRGVLRPRVFWDSGRGRTLFATTGVTYEDRAGGAANAAIPSAIGTGYRESLETVRVDGGLVTQLVLSDRFVLTGRAALARQRHHHQFGEVLERDRHLTSFGEVALRGSAGLHTWVVGAAVERDAYTPIDLPRFAYTFTVPGVFVQDDIQATRWLSISASGRLDHHSAYGTFLSPRLSGLVKGGGWTGRLSVGAGFYGPTFLTEETEAAGLSRLTVPHPLVAERGRSASLDVGRSIGPATANVTLFASRVTHPVDVDRSTAFVLTNLPAPTTNTGAELLATVRRAPFALTATYTYVDARETPDAVRVDVPLTPRHSAGLVGMAESEDVGRAGIEVYYTGAQRLEDNPYRDRSRPYWIVGFLIERRFGRARLFLNAENVTNVRQSQWDPLLLPSRAPDGRWTVDAWAPLDGRVFNGGVRLGL